MDGGIKGGNAWPARNLKAAYDITLYLFLLA